jgi:hypothetical protein
MTHFEKWKTGSTTSTSSTTKIKWYWIAENTNQLSGAVAPENSSSTWPRHVEQIRAVQILVLNQFRLSKLKQQVT